MSQVSRRSEVVCINGVPSTPGYLLALLRELSHVPRVVTEIAKAKQERKTNQTGISYQFKKGSESRSSRLEPKISLISFSRGSSPPLSLELQTWFISNTGMIVRSHTFFLTFFFLEQNYSFVQKKNTVPWFSSRLYYTFGQGPDQHIIRCLKIKSVPYRNVKIRWVQTFA